MKPDYNPVERSIEIATARGASSAEAYQERDLGLSIKVFGGQVEAYSYEESRGIGLRLFLGDRVGRAYSSDLSDPALSDAVDAALEAARYSTPDPDRALPPGPSMDNGVSRDGFSGEALGIFVEDDAEAPDKIEFTIAMEKSALRRDDRVAAVETSSFFESRGEVVLANSSGLRGSFRRSVAYAYLSVIAEENGQQQTGFGFTAGRSFSELDADAAAAEGTSMAVELLGGRQVPSARVPVLIDNLSTAELIATLGAAASGESVIKGRSYLAGRLGEQVCSGLLTVVDDGRLPAGYGTAPFDAEGVSSMRTEIIGAGILNGLLHNSFSARKGGVSSTGNASRASFRSQVGVSPSNLMVEPGNKSMEQLLSEMGRGFLVRELQGVHVGLNPVSGEVSIGAKGMWIENGEPVHAVREVTIAGTLDEILGRVVGVGNDLRLTPLQGSVGAPCMLIDGVALSGS